MLPAIGTPVAEMADYAAPHDRFRPRGTPCPPCRDEAVGMRTLPASASGCARGSRDEPRQRHARAVQRVDELRACRSVAVEADVGPAGLEVLEVAAGGDLQPSSLPGRPQLDVVALGRGEADVPRAELQHAVGQPEPLEDSSRVGQRASRAPRRRSPARRT